MENKKQEVGFTLLEMLLVLAIMSTVLMMLVGYTTQRFDQFRRDKTVIQMQQILNAGMSYYINTSSWPLETATPATKCIATASGVITTTKENYEVLLPTYLPAKMKTNSWGKNYQVGCNSATGIFEVTSVANNIADANGVAGSLPLGFVTTGGGTPPAAPFTIHAQVNIPGQNLNNARSMNFAGTYRHGACVPVPKCPGTMTAQLFLTPVSVTGANYSGDSTTYPLHSFTAYYKGPSALGAVGADAKVEECESNTQSSCPSTSTATTNLDATISYWRACMQIITSNGDVAITNTSTSTGAAGTAWGQNAAMAAFTRCQPAGEKIGSDFTVFTN